MEIVDCIQGSDEWYAARLGKVTASEFNKVLNKKEGRGLYMRKKAAERLTGHGEESFRNSIMDNGSETEDEARDCYGLIYDQRVRQVGFVILNDWVGASTDGFVGTGGILEIKCPLGSTHIDYIIKDKVPPVYTPQIQGGLWVTGRKWCDFISYVPSLLSRPIHRIRIERDEDYIKNLELKTNEFVGELRMLISKIEKGAF